MAASKPCGCGTCPACKTKKNPAFKRNQNLPARKKNSKGKMKSKGKNVNM